MTQPYRNDQGPSLSASHVGLEELFFNNQAPSDVPGGRTNVSWELKIKIIEITVTIIIEKKYLDAMFPAGLGL